MNLVFKGRFCLRIWEIFLLVGVRGPLRSSHVKIESWITSHRWEQSCRRDILQSSLCHMNFIITSLTVGSLWLSGRASERGIRWSEVRFPMGPQNFSSIPRSWRNRKHLSLNFTFVLMPVLPSEPLFRSRVLNNRDHRFIGQHLYRWYLQRDDNATF